MEQVERLRAVQARLGGASRSDVIRRAIEAFLRRFERKACEGATEDVEEGNADAAVTS
jgi:hypothetical protein